MKAKKTNIGSHIIETSIALAPGIPLNVYLIKGEEQAVFIDSGIKQMHPALKQTLGNSKLAYILNTHSHHDHIGGNGQLVELTGCKVLAPKTYAHWHSNFEKHYTEFARTFPSIFHDTQELRNEVLDVLDTPHVIDEFLYPGITIDLGDDVRLEGIVFSGHMLEEFGWLEQISKTLILGDVVTLMDSPFIHGHVTVSGYRSSLKMLTKLMEEREIGQVLMAHFRPMNAQQFGVLIEQAYAYILRLEECVFEVVMEGNYRLELIWKAVCDKLGKEHEFRSLATVHAHLQDLVDKQKIRKVSEEWYEIND